MSAKSFRIGSVEVGLNSGLFLIAGPCVIEEESTCLSIGEHLRKISDTTGVPVIYKASFDKANRSSITSFRGPGIDAGLKVLAKVREATGLPLVTDVHIPEQAAVAASVVDCIQIPAFLCRQTDLLVACAQTGKPVNVKKGQFVSPAEMSNAVGKIQSAGNDKVLLTERGTFFGYNSLVNDMTAIFGMQQLGCPVVFDGTHSTQRPGGLGNASGGSREMAPILSRSAVAAGANGLFLEVHTDPAKAQCDAASMMPIDWVEDLLKQCLEIFNVIRS